MMKIIRYILPVLVFVVYGVTPSFSQELVNETFEATLDYNKTENALTYYNIVEISEALSKSGEKSDTGFDHEVRVTNTYEAERPSIEEIGPLGDKNWVLKTGSSILHRTVNMRHYVEIAYIFDTYIENIAISLEYLNTRTVGGEIEIIIGQVNDDGNLIWQKSSKHLSPWYWVSRYSNIEDRTWWPLVRSVKAIDRMVKDRPVNFIAIREIDITDGPGTGYIDNIVIRANPVVEQEERETSYHYDIWSPTGAVHVYKNKTSTGLIAINDPVTARPPWTTRGMSSRNGSGIHRPDTVRSNWSDSSASATRRKRGKVVSIEGYVRDELSIAGDGNANGNGISSAYLKIDTVGKIVLKNNTTDLLDADGHFSIKVRIKTNNEGNTNTVKCSNKENMDKKYKVKLYAADNYPEQSGGPNSGLVDKTYISHGELVKSGTSDIQ